MGFWDRLFGAQQPAASTSRPRPAPPSRLKALDPYSGPPPPWREADERDPAHGFVPVVGESNYQESLAQLSALFELIDRPDRNFIVKVVADPSNAHDSNAVKITTEKGDTIGYLPRDIAKSYHAVIARQPAIVRCPAQLRGEEPRIGVVLDFIHVRELKDEPPRRV